MFTSVTAVVFPNVLIDPVPVLVYVRRIYNEHVLDLADAVHEQVVDNATPTVGQVAVLDFSVEESAGVVGRYTLNQVKCPFAFEDELAHVRDIEHADAVADRIVFVEVGGVADGHFVARERHDLRAQLLMNVMERNLL